MTNDEGVRVRWAVMCKLFSYNESMSDEDYIYPNKVW